MPGLARAQDEFVEDGLQVVALNLFPDFHSLGDLAAYGASKGAANLTWSQDIGTTVARSYAVTSLGETVIIDRQRQIAGRFKGPVPYPALQDMVQRAAAR